MIENHWKQVKKIEKAQIVRKYLQEKWMEKGWKGFQISIAQHVSTALKPNSWVFARIQAEKCQEIPHLNFGAVKSGRRMESLAAHIK